MKNLMKSHLTRGAWIEMAISATTRYCRFGRTSHEVRGLKCDRVDFFSSRIVSHLTRGVWIEINRAIGNCFRTKGRTSHEVRGLK